MRRWNASINYCTISKMKSERGDFFNGLLTLHFCFNLTNFAYRKYRMKKTPRHNLLDWKLFYQMNIKVYCWSITYKIPCCKDEDKTNLYKCRIINITPVILGIKENIVHDKTQKNLSIIHNMALFTSFVTLTSFT